MSTSGGHLLEIENVGKTYGSGQKATHAIADVSFAVDDREFVCVVGPSGCGKTTLLRCIANLLDSDGGEVRYRGQSVRGVLPGLQIVFQEFNRSLFPWLSVERNVRFPLHDLSKSEAGARADEALRLVHLEGFAHHYPWQLSGGMQQRVALARAIAAQAELVLMDEPFASVDAQTRIALEMMLLAVWQQLGLSILFVTHDIDEAILLSDRVLVLSQRPSSVIAEIDVDLPRPRDQLKTKELPRFQDLREEIFALLGLDRQELTQPSELR